MARSAGKDVSTVLTALGRAARRERRALGLTQVELAGLCGVGVRFVSELESGKPTLEIGRAVHVLQHLGLDLDVKHRTWSPADALDDAPASRSA